MSDSPWSVREVLMQIQEEISQAPEFSTGSILILDEGINEDSSEETASAVQRGHEPLSKAEMSQAGIYLAYANDGLWICIDGELFLPESWFGVEMAKTRARLGIPPDRRFTTKVELGWKMVERVAGKGVPFELICLDTFYGRSHWMRRKVAGLNLTYMADVPFDQQVYLDRRPAGESDYDSGKDHGSESKYVLSHGSPIEVRQLGEDPLTHWERVRVRITGCKEVRDEFSVRPVWTRLEHEDPVQEWLVMQRGEGDRICYALSNATPETSLERLAWSKCQRAFIEDSTRQAKNAIDGGPSRRQRYPDWEHRLVLGCLAIWFVTQNKMEFRENYQRGQELVEKPNVVQPLLLSMAGINYLLSVVMQLPQLTREYAVELVIEYLISRARSLKSQQNSSDRENYMH
jgi:SRSO17 transposase